MAIVKKATAKSANKSQGYSLTLTSEGKKPFQLRGVFINILEENSLKDYDLSIDNLIHLLQSRQLTLNEVGGEKTTPDVLLD